MTGNLKKYLIGIIAIVALMIAIPAIATAADPPGTITPVAGTTYSGYYDGNTSRYFKVVFKTSGKLVLNARASGNNPLYLHLNVLDSNSNVINNFDGSQEFNDYVIKDGTTYLNKGTYYVELNDDGYWGYYDYNYTIKFGWQSVKESFPEPFGGSNNSFATANTIAVNKAYRGMVPTNGENNDQYDVYKFTIPSPGSRVVIKTSSNTFTDLYLTLYDSKGYKIDSNHLYFDSRSYKATSYAYYLAPGTYYVSYDISSYPYYYGPYDFMIVAPPRSAPTNVKASPISVARGGSSTVSWTKVAGAGKYRVRLYRKTSWGTWGEVYSGDYGDVSSVTLRNLNYRGWYKVFVYAGNSAGWHSPGKWSNSFKVQ